jgi:membrane associated rhomboid family serine protease
MVLPQDDLLLDLLCRLSCESVSFISRWNAISEVAVMALARHGAASYIESQVGDRTFSSCAAVHTVETKLLFVVLQLWRPTLTPFVHQGAGHLLFLRSLSLAIGTGPRRALREA